MPRELRLSRSVEHFLCGQEKKRLAKGRVAIFLVDCSIDGEILFTFGIRRHFGLLQGRSSFPIVCVCVYAPVCLCVCVAFDCLA